MKLLIGQGCPALKVNHRVGRNKRGILPAPLAVVAVATLADVLFVR